MNRRIPAPGVWLAAAAAVAALSGLQDRNFWGFLFANPASFDFSSLLFILFEQVLPVLGVALGGLACWGIGRLALRALRIRGDACASFGLGLGLLACSVAALGSMGSLNRAAIGILMGVAAATAIYGIRRAPPAGRHDLRPLPLWTLTLIAPTTYAAFHALILALTPPTGYDVTAYHLAIPRLYLRAGAITSLPWLFHSRWPHLMEVFYSVPLALGCDRAAALVHAMACAVLTTAIYHAAREELDKDAALLAAAIFVSQPVLHYVMADAHSDGALALFHFLACWALWRWTQTPARGWLIASAFLSGCGAACKLQGLVLTLTLAFMARRRRADALLFLGVSALIFGPWLLRTWLATGNPVWPFVFGGSDHAARLAADLHAFNGWEFPRDFPLFLRYGPHFLLLPLMGLLIIAGPHRRPPQFLSFMLVPVLPLALAASPSHELWRYILPVVPALAMAAAWLALTMVRRGGWRKMTAIAVLAFALSPALTLSQSNELFYVLGLKSVQDPGADPRAHYLERATPYYPFFKEASSLLGPRDKVLLLREVRGYHLDANYEWFEPSVQYDLEARADALQALRERGFTHVIVHDEPGWFNSFTPFSTGSGGAVEDAIEHRGRLVLRQGAYALFALPPA